MAEQVILIIIFSSRSKDVLASPEWLDLAYLETFLIVSLTLQQKNTVHIEC